MPLSIWKTSSVSYAIHLAYQHCFGVHPAFDDMQPRFVSVVMFYKGFDKNYTFPHSNSSRELLKNDPFTKLSSIVACAVVAWLLRQYLPSHVGARGAAMYCIWEGGFCCRGDYLAKKVSVVCAGCILYSMCA